MSLTTGQILLNRYRIISLLGQGGFGAVYEAWDINLEQPVAVKENLDVSPQAQRQFQIEAQILSRLSHPNLPRVTDHFFIPNCGQYLVMDFIDGHDLEEILAQQGPLPEAMVLPWILQVCDALIYLHSQMPPVIHRDIKPANIKITMQGRAVLVDFGISKTYDPALSTTVGARAVTPGYSPPEQYGQGQTDACSDIYALGATLYALLTGQQPTVSVILLANNTSLTPPRQAVPAISLRTEAAILHACQTAKAHRFQNVSEFAAAIRQPGDEKSANIPRWLWGSLVALLAVLLLGGGIWIGRILAPTPTPAATVSRNVTPIVLSTVTWTPTSISTREPEPSPTSPPAPTSTRTLESTISSTATVTPTPSLGIGSILVSDKDGMVMVYVPAGAFQMGSEEGDDEFLRHEVYLDAFWIDRTEVTNARFAAFLNVQGNQNEGGASWLDIEDEDCRIELSGEQFAPQKGYEQHPVVEVSWHGANAYCTWAERRLPTEAEWEKAARGTDKRVYPWGNDFDCKLGNFDDETKIDPSIVPGGPDCDGYERTAPVGSYSGGASPYGALDMAGNVWEWTGSLYKAYPYDSNDGREHLQAEGNRVLRGGSWLNYAWNARAAYRFELDPTVANYDIGFRCVFPISGSGS